jgi:pimeloyl-ACP methyl ester carboxylesterase
VRSPRLRASRRRSTHGAMLKLLAPALLAAPLLLAAPVSVRAEPARYEAAPCLADFGPLAARASCGVLTVDETRGSDNGRRVAIPVVVVKAAAPKGLPPVIYLHGGPGGDAVEGAAGVLRSDIGRELYAQDQDWVIFDQRGGGLSSPALDCGEVALNDAGPLSPTAADALVACAARHRAAGVDLARYNTIEIVQDIQDLRRALGYERFDIYGVSYGTRVGLALIRYAPEGLRAAVLDSVWPPEADWAQDGPKMVADAIALVVARCEADAACRARYPRLRGEVDALARRWAQPQTIKNRRYRPEDLGAFLMDAAYFDAAGLPRDLTKLAAGDLAPLNAHIAGRSGYLEAQHLTHLCKEEFPFEDRAAVARSAGDDPVARLTVASFERYFDVCRAYPVGAPDPREAEPISSSLPTLFLGAEIDPGCPPAIARATAARFSRGQLVIAPNTTHGVAYQSACARRLVRAFLAAPDRPVDPACMAGPEHAKLEFATE